MKKIILFILFVAIISSCAKDNTPIEVVKTVNFKTKVGGLFFWDINYCYDKNLHKEFVFFAYNNSFIKSFDLDGNLIDSISLKNYIDITKRPILNFSAYTKDTIILYPEYSKKSFLACINNKGEILKSYNINDLLDDSIKDYVRFICSHSTYPITIDKLYFEAIPNFYTLVDKLGIKEEKTIQLEHKLYYTQWMNYTCMLELNNFLTDTPTANLILSDYYKTNYIEGDMNSYPDKGYYFFAHEKNLLFLMNSCLSKITIFDTETHKQVKAINITSKYTKVGKEPFYCTNRDYLTGGRYTTKFNCYAAKIDKMLFNKKTKQYYIILSHKLENYDEWLNYNNGDYRPFSVIIYDENFENPKEYAFEAHTYIARNCFMSQEGLWMQRKPEQLTKENYGTQTFDLLKFN